MARGGGHFAGRPTWRLQLPAAARSYLPAVGACALVIILQCLAFVALTFPSQGRDVMLIMVTNDRLTLLLWFCAMLALFGINCYAASAFLLADWREKSPYEQIDLARLERVALATGVLPSFLMQIACLTLYRDGPLLDAQGNIWWEPFTGGIMCLIGGLVSLIGIILIERVFVRRQFSGHARYTIVDRNFRRYYPQVVLVLISIFSLAIIWSPWLQRTVGPGAVFLLGLNLYIAVLMILTTLLRLSVKWILALLVGLAALTGAIGSERHYVRTAAPAEIRPTMAVHADAWLANAAARNEGPVDAVIVLAEGGGIRAAQHSGTFLSALQAETGGDFLPGIYLMSGVSGGSFGITSFLADQATPGTDPDQCRLDHLYGLDHMTSLFAGLLLVDIPLRLLPTQGVEDLFSASREAHPDNLVDRADLFETSFARGWTNAIKSCGGTAPPEPVFDWPIETLVKIAAGGTAAHDTGVAPIVFFGTLRAHDGQPAVVSNVDPAAPGEAAVVASVHDDLGGRTMPAAAAAHVSARFPFVNPPAVTRIRQGEAGRLIHHRYVDGAYYDNSGAGAAQQAVIALLDAAEAQGVAERLRITVVHIYARNTYKADPDSAPQPVDLFAQTSTPVRGLLSARGTRGRLPTVGLCRLIAEGDAARTCEQLHLYSRAWNGADAPWQQPGDKAVVTAFSTQEGSRLNWVNAPLDTSLDPRSERYAPLGWLLNNQSRDYISAEAKAMAAAVCRSFGDRAPGLAANGCASDTDDRR